jgi:glycosyltransferase involved in cell wall biosynthesis
MCAGSLVAGAAGARSDVVRIAYLTHARIPSRAANNVQTMKMCEAFVAAGHPTRLFCREGDDAVDVHERYGVAAGFDVVAVAAGGLRGTRTAGWLHGLRARVLDFRPDLLFSRDLFALAALADRGLPMIYEAHWSPRHRPVLRATLLGLLAHRCFRRVVSISHALRAELLQLFPGLDPAMVVVAPSAADAVLAPSVVDDQHSPGIVVPGGSALRVGDAGQLYPGKGAELLPAIARLLPQVEFHAVGGDPADVARSRSLSPGNLQFHGHLAHRDVQEFIGQMDVVVAPYQSQVNVSGGAEVSQWMSPLKIFEYMSAARAIVASDLPVIREALRHDHNALLVPPAAPEAWAEAIARLVDVDLRARLGSAALQDFTARHTWPKRARAVLADLPDPVTRRCAWARAGRSLVSA